MNVTIAPAQGARPEQQDTALVENIRGVLVAVLADGMGGHNGGALASTAAVHAALALLRRRWLTVASGDPKRINGALADAVERAAQAVDRIGGMYRAPGSTLVIAVIRDDAVHLAQVGDSWCRIGGWMATTPHNLAHLGAPHRLTSSLPDVERLMLHRVAFEEYLSDDIVIASDGVDTDVPTADAETMVRTQLARKKPRQDNATAIVLRPGARLGGPTWAPKQIEPEVAGG